jgi:hypothetical protein
MKISRPTDGPQNELIQQRPGSAQLETEKPEPTMSINSPLVCVGSLLAEKNTKCGCDNTIVHSADTRERRDKPLPLDLVRCD